MYDINLLPEELRLSREILPRRKLPYLMLGMALFALFSLYLFLLIHSQVLENRLEHVKEQIEIYEGREKKVSQEQEILQNLQKKKEEVKMASESRIYWSKFLIEVEEALPAGVWLRSLEVGPENKLKIVGVSYSFESIGDFYVALKGVSLLENVNLESVQEKGENESGKSLLEFTITADVNP